MSPHVFFELHTAATSACVGHQSPGNCVLQVFAETPETIGLQLNAFGSFAASVDTAYTPGAANVKTAVAAAATQIRGDLNWKKMESRKKKRVKMKMKQ